VLERGVMAVLNRHAFVIDNANSGAVGSRKPSRMDRRRASYLRGVALRQRRSWKSRHRTTPYRD
jgi:hypothetical protein